MKRRANHVRRGSAWTGIALVLAAAGIGAADIAEKSPADACEESVGTEQAGLYGEPQVWGFDLNDSGG
jgi:hypothetical protein